MNVFAWILFGLLVGGVAKFIMPGKDPGGCLATVILGIIGAVIGGAIGKWIGVGPVTGFNPLSLGLSILGAFFFLLIFRLILAHRLRKRD